MQSEFKKSSMIEDSISGSSSDDEHDVKHDFEGLDEYSKVNDVLKILVTTDNHLGFMEKDAERGNDSFIAFEEALEIAKQEKVDFILLGGDLFHENKPSRDCLTKCQKMLREHCFGTKKIAFDIVSDENVNFGHTGFPYANFNDPNLNVSIPVFSIHGNHDDPTGANNLCALDTLAAAGLINYFGKSNAADQNTGNTTSHIDIKPVLIQKGCTKLAIFGLGAIKDERLHNMFEKGHVEFARPSECEDEWFNLFITHQNRSAHGKKNYIPEGFLANFLDLVIWGHEHECRIRPEYNELQEFYVTQPGSSVITSLSESEIAPKHVALLKVYKNNFKLKPIPLRSIRPFMLDTIVLNDQQTLNETDKNIEIKIEQVLVKKVNKMIEECLKNRYSYEKQPKKPLIRLKVDYTNYEPISEIRFAQKFVDKVANPKNILQFFKRNTEAHEVTKLDPEAAKVLRMHGNSDPLEYVKVQDLVVKYFKKAEDKNKMQVITEKGVSDAIKEFIEKDEKDAISELINFQIDKIQKYLKAKCTNFQNDYVINEEIKKFQKLRVTANDEEDNEIKEIFEKSRKELSNTQSTNRSRANTKKTVLDEDNDFDFKVNDSDEEIHAASKQKLARQIKKKESDDDDIFNDKNADFDDEPKETAKPARGRGRGRGRGSRGGRGAASVSKTTIKSTQQTLAFEPSSSKLNQSELSQQIFGVRKLSPSQDKKKSQSSKLIVEDTDDEVCIEEEDDDDIPSTTKGNVVIPSSFSVANKKPAIQTQTQTQTQRSGSNRRTRIDYEDDSDEEFQVLQSKKPKAEPERKPFSLFQNKRGF